MNSGVLANNQNSLIISCWRFVLVSSVEPILFSKPLLTKGVTFEQPPQILPRSSHLIIPLALWCGRHPHITAEETERLREASCKVSHWVTAATSPLWLKTRFSLSLSLLNYCLPAGGNVAKHPARQEEARKRLNWSRIINFGVTQYWRIFESVSFSFSI